MTSRILLLGVALIGLGSCSTMYKSGQTPDDLYYSPAPQLRTASSDNDESDDRYNNNGSDEYVNVQTEQDRSAYTSEDNYLRMKVRNRSMWSAFDSYSMYDGMYSPYYGGFGGMGMGYGYNPYSFYSPYSMYSPYSYMGSGWGLGLGFGGLYGGWNSFYNPYNSFYSPYYGYGGGGYYYPGTIKSGTTRPANSYRPRAYNLGSYGTSNNSGRVTNTTNTPRRVFRNSDNNYVSPGGSSGNSSPRRSSSFSSGNDSRPSRTFDSPRSSSTPSYSPSSSGGSSRGGGGGGGSAPSRPGRN